MENRAKQLEMMRNWVAEEYDYDDLGNAVIDIIEEESEGLPTEYMKDVYEHGCVSGCVGALIYYYQTEEFFKKHMDDIFTVYNELRDMYGDCPIRKDYDVNANSLSWMAFEEVNRLLLDMLAEG